MELPDISKLSPLPGPFEVLDIQGNSTREFTVTRFQTGTMLIRPRDQRDAKTIVALRVYVPKEDKSLYPDYWDLTAQTLIPQVLPFLEQAQGKPVRFRVGKFGSGPTARFQVTKLATP